MSMFLARIFIDLVDLFFLIQYSIHLRRIQFKLRVKGLAHWFPVTPGICTHSPANINPEPHLLR